jgi:triosephosphate isomerase
MKKIVIANWKMNLAPETEALLAKEIVKKSKKVGGSDLVLCPSFLGVTGVAKHLEKSEVKLGAQDVFWADRGAFTGEVSAKFLKSAGADYVIIGHSERRAQGETDEMVNKKIGSALAAGLTPIFCLGEDMDHRHEGRTDHVIMKQVQAGLDKIDLLHSEHLIIAYEPLWAIGTGHAASPEDAEHVFHLIKHLISDLWPITVVSNNVRFVYGGSVEPDNAKSFMKALLCNGLLVGGASLDADKLLKISQAGE